MASRSVQTFLAGLTNVSDQQTDKQTDRPRYSICSNIPHLVIVRCRLIIIIIIIIIMAVIGGG